MRLDIDYLSDNEYEENKNNLVNHPSHYNQNGIEVIDIIEAYNLNFNLGNVIKYILRSDFKENKRQDLEKALWYLEREVRQCQK